MLVRVRRSLGRSFPETIFWLRRLRELLSPVRLPAIGEACSIHPMAIFSGHIDGISLGSRVRLEAYTQIYNTRGSKISIGSNTTLTMFATVKTTAADASIEIGERCSIQHYSLIYGAGPVSIGNNVRIASHTTIIPANKIFADPDTPIRSQGVRTVGITLEDDIWIGSGVTVLDGVHLGHGSVVAAGAVVNRSCPPNSVLAGVPARIIGTRGEPSSELLEKMELTADRAPSASPAD